MGYFEDTLLDCVQGRISISEMRRVLGHRATFSFGTNPAYVNWNQPLPPGTAIPMTLEDVRRALNRYLDGEVAGDALREWAEFITLTGSFAAPDPPPEDEDYYDDLWDVVHELGTPEAFGPITREAVLAKLDRLTRYDLDAPPGTV